MSSTNEDSGRVLRWGICSAGKISHDFVTALKTSGLPAYGYNEAVAVAARDLQRALQFGKLHGIDRCYGSYEELARDPDVEVVYIGAITSEHYALSKLMLEGGKHVLCEKTMMLNSKQTEDILLLAKDKKLFIMEAMWTRFFPAIEKLKEALSLRVVGQPLLLEVSFGAPIAHVERLHRPELGGGCLLDLFIYAVQMASLVFGGKPKSVTGKGSLFPSGVEESCVAILEYEGGKHAQLVVDCRTRLRNSAAIYGTEGRIEIPTPFHAPTSIILPDGKHDYPLPPDECSPLKFNFSNSSGLSYQVASVRECIMQGKLENPLVSHEDSLDFIRIIDSLRRQLGSEVF